jgi:hypothetical protein
LIDAAKLSKFKRRAPKIATQTHLDKCMLGFPVEHHDEIATQLQPLLKEKLIARKVESLPELKPQNPEAPTLHESTVMRLNKQQEIVAGLEAQIKELKAENTQLREKLQDSGMK